MNHGYIFSLLRKLIDKHFDTTIMVSVNRNVKVVIIIKMLEMIVITSTLSYINYVLNNYQEHNALMNAIRYRENENIEKSKHKF